jgi:hypothetical protein
MSQRIDLRHDGSRIVLPVLILEPSPSVSFEGHRGFALLDTGSTATGVTKRIANQMSLVGRGKRPIGSAQGEGQAERYLFRIGVHGDGGSPTLPYVFDDVIGFELVDSFRFDALIGMDILKQCDLELRRDGSGILIVG